jgi:hypothetical protein
MRLPNGQSLPPFFANTRKVEAEEKREMFERIRDRSRRVLARPRGEVEAELQELMGPPPQQVDQDAEFIFEE